MFFASERTISDIFTSHAASQPLNHCFELQMPTKNPTPPVARRHPAGRVTPTEPHVSLSQFPHDVLLGVLVFILPVEIDSINGHNVLLSQFITLAFAILYLHILVFVLAGPCDFHIVIITLRVEILLEPVQHYGFMGLHFLAEQHRCI